VRQGGGGREHRVHQDTEAQHPDASEVVGDDAEEHRADRPAEQEDRHAQPDVEDDFSAAGPRTQEFGDGRPDDEGEQGDVESLEAPSQSGSCERRPLVSLDGLLGVVSCVEHWPLL